MKIVIDAGHGPSTPGKRSPDGMKEYDFNRAVAAEMKKELEKYKGVTVYLAHDDSRDVPLSERTRRANDLNVNLYFSIHANAYTGEMGDHGGIETYVHVSKPQQALKLAEQVQSQLVKATKLRDRGVKTANFHVLRETSMTAVLVEHGFMDSKTDLPKLKSSSFRKLCGKTNATTVARFFNLKKQIAKKPIQKQTLYKVQVGAFKQLKNAENLAAKLKKAGYDTYIEKRTK